MVRHNTNRNWQRETPIPRARPVDPVPATPDEQALLERIAAIRAEGAGWDQTGEKLKRPAAELETLARAHPLLFRRLMNRADREMAREDRRVARIVFRKQMRKDPESQAARLSAQCLVNIDLTYFRHRNKKPRYFGLDPNDPQLQAALRMVKTRRSMTPKQLIRFLANMRTTPLPAWAFEDDAPDYPPDDPGNLVPRDPTPPADSGGGYSRTRRGQ